jgi:hypothetical protein
MKSLVICLLLVLQGGPPPMEWHFDHSVDKMDDVTVDTLLLLSEENDSGSMGLVCRGGKTTVAFLFKDTPDSHAGSVPMRVRFGKHAPTYIWFEPLSSADAVKSRDPFNLLDSALAVDEVIVQYDALLGGSRVVSFDVRGLPDALRKHPTACGWEVKVPRVSPAKQ